MTEWEEMKRTGQTAFISQGNGLPDMHESIGEMYRQILSTGHIYPSAGAESLTRQIAEGTIEPPETPQPEITRSAEQERDIEPER